MSKYSIRCNLFFAIAAALSFACSCAAQKSKEGATVFVKNSSDKGDRGSSNSSSGTTEDENISIPKEVNGSGDPPPEIFGETPEASEDLSANKVLYGKICEEVNPNSSSHEAPRSFEFKEDDSFETNNIYTGMMMSGKFVLTDKNIRLLYMDGERVVESDSFPVSVSGASVSIEDEGTIFQCEAK